MACKFVAESLSTELDRLAQCLSLGQDAQAGEAMARVLAWPSAILRADLGQENNNARYTNSAERIHARCLMWARGNFEPLLPELFLNGEMADAPRPPQPRRGALPLRSHSVREARLQEDVDSLAQQERQRRREDRLYASVMEAVQANDISTAMRRLTQKAWESAPVTETEAALRALHPEASEHDQERTAAWAREVLVDRQRRLARALPREDDEADAEEDRRLRVTASALRHAIRSSRQTAAAGPSGLSPRHLHALATTSCFVESLVRVGQAMVNIGLPPAVAKLWSTARLVAVPKPNGKIRPIAIGDTLLRAVSRCVARSRMKHWGGVLSPVQYAIGVPGGIELIPRLVAAALEKADQVAVLLDLKNAYNSISRIRILEDATRLDPEAGPFLASILAAPTPLLFNGTQLCLSTEGVRQGDPCAPWLFSAGIQSALLAAQEATHGEAGVVAYLDDVAVVGPPDAVARALSTLKERFIPLGLTLNAEKCVLLSPSGGSSPDLDNETVGFRRAQHGTEVLGAPIGVGPAGDAAIKAAVHDKLQAAIEQARLVAEFGTKHPQYGMLLLRGSVSALVVSLCRNVPPRLLIESLANFDDAVTQALAAILQTDQSSLLLDSLAGQQRVIPVRHGGLGLPRAAQTAGPAYLAAEIECRSRVNERLRALGWDDVVTAREDRLWSVDGGPRESVEAELRDIMDRIWQKALRIKQLAPEPPQDDVAPEDPEVEQDHLDDPPAEDAPNAGADAAAVAGVAARQNGPGGAPARRGQRPSARIELSPDGLTYVDHEAAGAALGILEQFRQSGQRPPPAQASVFNKTQRTLAGVGMIDLRMDWWSAASLVDRARLNSAGGAGACWVTTIPVNKTRELSPASYRTCMRLRLGLALPELEIAQRAGRRTCVCSTPFDTHGHHILACPQTGALTWRHTAVLKAIEVACRATGCVVHHEVVADAASNKRFDAVLVDADARRVLAIDLSIVTPLGASLTSESVRLPGTRAALQEREKRSKYRREVERRREQAAAGNNAVAETFEFLPVVFESLGRPGTDVFKFLRDITDSARRRWIAVGGDEHQFNAGFTRRRFLETFALAVQRQNAAMLWHLSNRYLNGVGSDIHHRLLRDMVAGL